MTKTVPIEAARKVEGWLERALREKLFPLFSTRKAMRELVEFALQFETVQVPGEMQNVVAGEQREIILTLPSCNAEELDLIRVNGRTFAPEVLGAMFAPVIEGEELSDGRVAYPLTEDEAKAVEKLLSELDAEIAWEDSNQRLIGKPLPTVAIAELRKLANGPKHLPMISLDSVKELLAFFEPGPEAPKEVEVDRTAAKIDDLKTTVIAFCGPFAVEWAKLNGWPDGEIAAHHYDILEDAGARMVDFKRREPET